MHRNRRLSAAARSVVSAVRRRAQVEPLESRRLMSGSISGVVLQDLTGNGPSADDIGLGGATVRLYKDVNGNGRLDAADGAAIATTHTAANGSFSFANLAAGKYLIADVPVNAVRTAPALSNTYAVTVTDGSNSGGFQFDNYVKSFKRSTLSGISYLIDGTKVVTNLAGNVHQGDTVEARFTVAAGANVTLSLVSYLAPTSSFNTAIASQQVVFDSQTQTFGPGAHTLTVNVHDCDFQIDFIGGAVIDHFGPAGSNIFYSQQCRLISSAFGGTHTCLPLSDPSSLSGRIFCDQNLNGVFDAGTDEALAGQAIMLTGTTTGGASVSLSTTTGADGTYRFTSLQPGTYSLVEPEPAGHVDAKNFADVPSGNGTAAQDLSTGRDTVSGIQIGSGQNLTGYDFVEVDLVSLSGMVFADANNNGIFDSIDVPLSGVTITLTGTNDLGQSVGPVVTTTDANGKYIFTNVRPGTYKIVETQPAGFQEGKDTIGTQGGDASVQDVFSNIVLPGCGPDGTGNNFAELGPPLAADSTATIGFWHNKNGQALLLSLNGGPNSTALGDWLAKTLPNLYGPTTLSTSNTFDLAGKTNSYIANSYLTNDFDVAGQKLDAQVLGAAFAVYVTDASLGGTAGTSYGFKVLPTGTGFETINVSSDGAAFGVPDNSTITVFQALQGANKQAANDVLYNGNTSLGNEANDIFDMINQGGDIG